MYNHTTLHPASQPPGTPSHHCHRHHHRHSGGRSVRAHESSPPPSALRQWSGASSTSTVSCPLAHSSIHLYTQPVQSLVSPRSAIYPHTDAGFHALTPTLDSERLQPMYTKHYTFHGRQTRLGGAQKSRALRQGKSLDA